MIVTHTDPAVDSRIIKTHLVAESNGRKSLSVGVLDPKAKKGGREQNVVRLMSRARDFRNSLFQERAAGRVASRSFFILIYLELTFRMLAHGLYFKPNVVHCNDWFVLPIAVVIKKMFNAQLIYDAHELESKTPEDPNFPGQFVERLEKFAWPSVDFFTTVSPSIRDWYMDHFGYKPSEIILNAPMLKTGDPKHKSTARNYFRDKFQIAASAKIYLYVGMLFGGRGIDLILDTFTKTESDSVVIFLGEGYYDEKIRQAAQASPRVYLHERVSHDQVVPMAKNADYGLCLIENASLSDYYCIPNKLLEYAFSGIPVVASKLPEIRRVVEDYRLGECFDNSTTELLRVLEENNHREVLNLADQNRLWQLSWEAQSMKLDTVFQKVLSARVRPK